MEGCGSLMALMPAGYNRRSIMKRELSGELVACWMGGEETPPKWSLDSLETGGQIVEHLVAEGPRHNE